MCLFKKKRRGFPGGSGAKNPPAAAADTGRAFMPQHNQAREPELPELEHPEAVLGDKKNHCNEKPGHGNETAAPTRHNWRRPTHTSEDPAQPKTNQ